MASNIFYFSNRMVDGTRVYRVGGQSYRRWCLVRSIELAELVALGTWDPQTLIDDFPFGAVGVSYTTRDPGTALKKGMLNPWSKEEIYSLGDWRLLCAKNRGLGIDVSRTFRGMR